MYCILFGWLFLSSLIKASTCSVVLLFYITNRALLVVFLFSLPLVHLHCIYFVNQLYILYYILIINFRLQCKGAPKYLGESVTGLKFGIQKQ